MQCKYGEGLRTDPPSPFFKLSKAFPWGGQAEEEMHPVPGSTPWGKQEWRHEREQQNGMHGSYKKTEGGIQKLQEEG